MHRDELNNPNYIRVVLTPGEKVQPWEIRRAVDYLWKSTAADQTNALMSGGQTWVSQK